MTDANAQSTPSTQGYMCYAINSLPQAGSSLHDAATELCNKNGWTLENGVCKNENGNTVSIPACYEAAVCLTGDGWIAADAGGYCPDPPPVGDEGDDDDGDGSDCDEGEEQELDCNDGDDDDTDSDGDGEPDAKDPDDGICSEIWNGPGDSDPDCQNDNNCSTDGEKRWVTYPPGQEPVNSICHTDNCLYTRCGISANLQGEQFSQYCPAGEECDPSNFDDNTCPQGQQDLGNGCEGIQNFCDIDEHTNGTQNNIPDGIPDNEGTYACGGTGQCDPLNEDCEANSAGLYACEDQTPPDCTSGDPVQCAQLELAWETTCGVTFTDTFDCEANFICTGHPIDCAKLELQQKEYCASLLTQEEQDDPFNLDNFRDGIDDGENYDGGSDIDGSELDYTDIDSDLDDSGYGLSRDCIADYQVNTPIKNFEIPFSVLCPLIEAAGAIVLLIGFFFASRIVGSAF